MSAIENRLYTALPYLDTLAMHLLYGTAKSAPTRRCTLMATRVDPPEQARVPEDLEREILIDIAPQIFIAPRIFPTITAPPALNKMTQKEQIQLAVDLAHSVPLPVLLKKLAFSTYRMWLRRADSRVRNKPK